MLNYNNNIKSQLPKYTTEFKCFDLLTKSIPILMGIFIFFNPFPHTTSIKEICFYLSVSVVTVLILSKKIEFRFKTPLLLPFGLFISWAFLSIFFALEKENSIHDFYSHLIRYVILYYILINFFNSEKYLLYLSRLIIISSTIFTMGGIIYFYFILGNPLKARFGVYSFVQTPINIIGVISVFAIFLALNHFNNERHLYYKIFLIYSIFVLFVGVVLTQSRSTLLAICLSLIYFFNNNKKWTFVFLGMILIVIALSPAKRRFRLNEIGSFLNNSRVNIDFITLEVIKDHPIIGIGFGLQTYEKLDLKKYKNRLAKNNYRKRKITTDPHNIVLDVAVRLGVVGLLFSFYIVFVFYKMIWNIIKYGKNTFLRKLGRCLGACFIAVFTIGLFQPIFSHMPEVVFCTIFSMITVVWRINSETISKEAV